MGLGWIGSGVTHSLWGLYFWYAVGGIGAGAVYGDCIGHALKWLPDHRGLCAGVTAGAYGVGTAVTADLFGKKHAATNSGIVSTAKGTASIFARPVAARDRRDRLAPAGSAGRSDPIHLHRWYAR